MDQNIDFFGSDQIQTPQYLEIHSTSQEISDEVFQANHSDQYKENLESSSNSNQETKGPPQDSDIRQLIREECCIEVCEEQKQNIEDMMLELEVKNVVEQPAECRTRIEKSLHNFRVIHKSSISLNNTSQISPVHAVAPILSTKEPEYSPSMGYEHPNTTSKTKSDEIIKSGVEELVPILSENAVTSEDKKECDMPVCENSPIFDDHYEIFSDSNNDDDISSDDDDFEDIEYVEASLPDPDIVSVEEENSSVSIPISEESDNSLSPEFKTFCDHTEETRSGNTTTHADDSLPEYDSFCFEIELDQERLINVVKNYISDDSSNDPLLEEADLFLASDNSIPPGIENFADDSKGDIPFLEALLIDDSIPFSNNESSKSDFDNLSFPRPPPEPLDADFDLDAGEEISVAIDKLECLDPNDKFDVLNDEDVNLFPFMFVIYSKMFLSFLSAESEDTIFDPGKDCAQTGKNQPKTKQNQTQDWKSTTQAGSTGIFLKESSNESSSGSNLANDQKSKSKKSKVQGPNLPNHQSFTRRVKSSILEILTFKWKKKNDVKARATLLLSLPNEHQLRFTKHSSRNEDGNTASVPTASTSVPTASASVATISQDTAYAYIASQSNGSQIKFKDINQIDEDDMEEMDIK
nr:hypothetical protein [Tanacetum cinerariifolium]